MGHNCVPDVGGSGVRWGRGPGPRRPTGTAKRWRLCLWPSHRALPVATPLSGGPPRRSCCGVGLLAASGGGAGPRGSLPELTDAGAGRISPRGRRALTEPEPEPSPGALGARMSPPPAPQTRCAEALRRAGAARAGDWAPQPRCPPGRPARGHRRPLPGRCEREQGMLGERPRPRRRGAARRPLVFGRRHDSTMRKCSHFKPPNYHVVLRK